MDCRGENGRKFKNNRKDPDAIVGNRDKGLSKLRRQRREGKKWKDETRSAARAGPLPTEAIACGREQRPRAAGHHSQVGVDCTHFVSQRLAAFIVSRGEMLFSCRLKTMG